MKGVSSLISFFSLTAIATVVSGCGNLNNNRQVSSRNYTVANADVAGSIGPTSNPNSRFTCPMAGVNNVVPVYDTALNGTGQFQACTSNTDVLVKGVGSYNQGDQICVFPVQSAAVNGQQQLQFVTDPTTDGPLSNCGASNSTVGSVFSFPSQTFNSVVIVEASSQAQMGQCLYYGTASMCPQQYSFGTIK